MQDKDIRDQEQIIPDIASEQDIHRIAQNEEDAFVAFVDGYSPVAYPPALAWTVGILAVAFIVGGFYFG